MNTTNLKNKIITLLKGNLTVEAAKSLGFQIYVGHHRYRFIDENKRDMVLEPIYEIDKYDKQYGLIFARGGETHVEIVDKETGLEAKATAICALTDSYERNTGIRYGLNRALRDMLKQIKHKETAPVSE